MMPAVEGEVEIDTISLKSKSGTVNATELLLFMSIYESIFFPGIYAEISIRDSSNMASILPLVGGETVTVEFKTPGKSSAKYEFALISMKNGVSEVTLQSRSYTLVCASKEAQKNKFTHMTKSYNTNISNMVKDVLTNQLKTQKSIDVQETKGVQPLLIQSLRPFDAINMMRKRSISSDDKSSTFLLFENQKGYHYKSLEKLFKDIDVGDRVFTNDITVKGDFFKPSFRNIIGYNQPQQYDTTLLKPKVQTRKFNIANTSYEKTDTQPYGGGKLSGMSSAEGGMKATNNQKFFDENSDSFATYSTIPIDSHKPDTFLPDTMANQRAFLSQVAQGSLMIHVIGDSELTAGIGFQSNITNPGFSTGASSEEKFISGKYLISAVRHMIGPPRAKPRYTCAIEGIKGSYKEDAS